ncbi:MAG: DUF1559 domain-containing protein [bacterium]|nr:DUF1559 domain-containing protein [bacterium]
MLLPALENARVRALKSTCVNNLKQLGVALHMYANDYDGWLPPYGRAQTLLGGRGEVSLTTPSPPSGSKYQNPWDINSAEVDRKCDYLLGSYYILTPEYIDVKMLFCPGGYEFGAGSSGNIVQGDMMADPKRQAKGMNDTYNHHNTSYALAAGVRIDRPEYKNVVIAADQNAVGSTFAGKFTGSGPWTIFWNRQPYGGSYYAALPGGGSTPGNRVFLRANVASTINHGYDGVNILLIDGSVKWIATKIRAGIYGYWSRTDGEILDYLVNP